jgi:hypothetical protein
VCEPVPPIDRRLTRRRLLVAGPAGLAALALLRPAAPVAAAPGLDIRSRSTWGGDLAPTRPIPDEPDVRVLLVHHSVNTNNYAQGAVPGMLRGIYSFHTGDKGWPDVAYNFFVDRFGGVWEGRTGSLAGAKAGDATGGNQGSSQLCCFLGDHSTEAPSAAAQASMAALLGWLADRHGVDLGDGARARFTSRGSNKFAVGATVDVPTVAGHRDVTQTACPGNAAYALVADGTLRRLARGGATAGPPTPPAPANTAPAPTKAAGPSSTSSTSSTTSSSTTSSTTSSSTTSTTAPANATGLASPLTVAGRPQPDGNAGAKLAAAAGAVLAAGAGAAVAIRSRRTGS